ncbi:S9 family peptidase [Uliginosibacterium sp. sgz301328]|uniref:S9 family peptidase n=1 Tax=Uliginosibacterium sp. sgz301328 TaxID=3243764 RepID=UPI00359D46D6
MTIEFDLSGTPPIAARRDRKLTQHGHTRIDPYHWMRRIDDPALRAFLQDENEYAARAMAPTVPLQESLYREMLARIKEADLSVPVRFGPWMYYSRTEAGQQYAIHVRRRITPDGWERSPEEVLLDENAEARGHTFYEVGDYEVSPSGMLLAWGEDTRGNRHYRLRVRNLATGRTQRFAINRVASIAWAANDETLFYVTEDTRTHRADRLWRLDLKTREKTLIFEERDERFNLLVAKTRSQQLLMMVSASHTTSETRILPADQPLGRWRMVRRRRANIEYEVDHHSDRLFIRINDTGPNFRLVEAPLADPVEANWVERIAHADGIVLEQIDLYQRWLVVSERMAGVPQLSITDLQDATTHRVAFDDPAYVVDIEDLPEWDSATLRYTYESFTTPDSIYEYDPATRQATLLKLTPVLGDFDPAHYVSERIHAVAADGTQIPVSLVRRRDTPLDGTAPVWLDGYGAYGMANDAWFSSTRLSLLDRGWIFALAHVRGGGDLGQRWHDGGRLANKRNSFTDYIACAERLVEGGYTSAGRILAQGGSAGGLLVATVLNLRPELFGAAILEVPFVDVVTTMLDPSLPLTVGEYEEWGDPQRATDYRRMLSWSPYDNIAAQAYPPMLIEAALHDSQVMVWEPAKYAARLRASRTDANPLLLVTHLEAGHGGASGRYEQLRERARQVAFALTTMAARGA